MKYIIWGAGQRGKKALEMVGEENVLCFVDSDLHRLHSVYCGKDVLSHQEASSQYQDYIYLITPHVGVEAIIERLESEGMHQFFKFSDCPNDLPIADCNIPLFDMYALDWDFSNCVICGIQWFSLLLYDKLAQNDVKTVLLAQETINRELLGLIQKEYCVVDSLPNIPDLDKVILMMDGFQKEMCVCEKQGVSLETIDQYLERNMNVLHPQLRQYKNIHSKARCFIVATGPSLRVEDLEVLREHKEICMSMNRIYNIFSRTEWRPDYYVIGDTKMIEDLAEDIASLPLTDKFVSDYPGKYWGLEKASASIAFNMLIQNNNAIEPGFSDCIEKCVYEGATVTYICMQIAAYMGFSEIILLGVDFNYSKDLYSPENHFEGCDSGDKPVRLNEINLQRNLQAYRKAKAYADEHGIRIINATRGGKLEVFERCEFERLF